MIGDNLKLIRRVWDKSGEEMSVLLGIKISAYRHYENEAREIPIEILYKIEDLTGIPNRKLYTKQLNKMDVPDKPIKYYEPKTEVDEVANEKSVYEMLKDMQKQIDELKQKK